MLRRAQGGDSDAAQSLLAQVYRQLRGMAQRQLARERAGHSLQATMLAHDAFLKLVDQKRVDWQSRAHFLSVAALAMRRILRNHAKARVADKRGGGQPMATFAEDALAGPMRPEQILALDGALEQLAALSRRQSDVVTYKFFGGLTYEEIAEVLDVSVPTVRRDWRFARAWLLREISQGAAP
jgi:RNA polymerase sigma factor (TIGR02999 family)